jgi:hypothetical protein
MLCIETGLRSRNAAKADFVRGMDAREFVLPSLGVSRLARFERMGDDIGLHISDSFASDARVRKLGQNMRICVEETHNDRPQSSISRSGDLADEEEEGRRS